MQTIKVNSTATTYGVAFSVKDGNFLGAVGPIRKTPANGADILTTAVCSLGALIAHLRTQ